MIEVDTAMWIDSQRGVGLDIHDGRETREGIGQTGDI
jgi:hypothetical protein